MSGQSTVISGTTTMTLPSANCADIRYLCVVMTIPGSASYNDADNADSSNIRCTDVTSLKNCVPGNVLSNTHVSRNYRRNLWVILFRGPSDQIAGPSVSFTIETNRQSLTELTMLVQWTIQITHNKYDPRMVHFQW